MVFEIWYVDVLLYTVETYEKALAHIEWFRVRGMEVIAVEVQSDSD